MASQLASFGFKYGLPLLNEGDNILDVRQYLKKNPYRDKTLRYLRGDSPKVIAELEKTPDLETSLFEIMLVASYTVGILYLGCTGGHHRSVYIANRLGKELNIDVVHLNYNYGRV